MDALYNRLLLTPSGVTESLDLGVGSTLLLCLSKGARRETVFLIAENPSVLNILRVQAQPPLSEESCLQGPPLARAHPVQDSHLHRCGAHTDKLLDGQGLRFLGIPAPPN